MDKRYQVFVSSTYVDLEEERKEVIQALLELDCIPSGMELFPAANEDQWSLIKRVIDDSDYYIVIIGGRYGSVGPDGISYTEMEYRYAMDTGKPIIAFIHSKPEEIPIGKSEKNKEGQEKLQLFLNLVREKLVKTWNNPTELGSVVSRSLVQLIKREPGIGWVKATNVPSEGATKELLKLKEKIEELEGQLSLARTTAPKGAELLSQGDNEFVINYSFEVDDPDSWENKLYNAEVSYTWNQIFYELSPLMIDEAIDSELIRTLNEVILKSEYNTLSDSVDLSIDEKIRRLLIDSSSYQTIKVQLRALGLIRRSEKSRSVKDTNTYWSLTEYGDEIMTRLRAIRR